MKIRWVAIAATALLGASASYGDGPRRTVAPFAENAAFLAGQPLLSKPIATSGVISHVVAAPRSSQCASCHAVPEPEASKAVRGLFGTAEGRRLFPDPIVGPLPAEYSDPAKNMEWSRLEAACEQVREPWEKLVARIGAASPQEVETAYLPYDRACLASPGQDGGVLAQVYAAIGVLIDRQTGEIFCAATRVARDFVLTARHCIQGASETQSLGQFEFRSMDLAGTAMSLKGIAWPTMAMGSFSKDENSADYALVELDTPTSFPHSLPIASATYLRRLYIVGPNAGTIALAANAKAPTDQWISRLRFARGRVCMSTGIWPRIGGASNDRECASHACQSAGGTSGSGVFQLSPTGELALVGIHLGAWRANPIKLSGGCEQHTYQYPGGSYTEINLFRNLDAKLIAAVQGHIAGH